MMISKQFTLKSLGLIAALLIGPTVASATVVAVIDTGADVNHTELQGSVWYNVDEIPNNGIDDDGDGYVDNINGWNFADNNADVSDQHGHGTHIAGVIKKFSLPSHPQFLILKYYDVRQTEAEQRTAFLNALKYAVAKKVDVINISAGGGRFSEDELALLREAKSKGIVVVAAAGNKKRHQKNINFYPSAYNESNVLAVAATNSSGQLLETSNQNLSKTCHYMNGYKVLGPVPGNKFAKKTGSSQAAAAFTGKLLRQSQLQHKSIKDVATSFIKKQIKIVADNS